MNNTVVMLTAYPYFPRLNGPGGKYFRPVNTFAVKGIAYDTVVKTMKDPVRAKKADELASGIAPRAVATTDTNRVE